MNFINWFSLSHAHQSILETLPPVTQSTLVSKPKKDQELLLDTYAKQDVDRREYIHSVLSQLEYDVQVELFKKETRLIRAFLMTDTCNLEKATHSIEAIVSVLMKKALEDDC